MTEYLGFFAWRVGIDPFDNEIAMNETGPLPITATDGVLETGESFQYNGVTYFLRGPINTISPAFSASTQPFGGGETWYFSQTDLFDNDSDLNGINYDPNGSFLLCFLPGTLIATPAGEAAVETLAIGDLVLTADGRAVPVRWLGRQTIMPMFGLPENRGPVLIRAGALGEGLPRRDLRVTSDHAMVLDGVLVQAGALVNGTTITRIPRAELGERLTVFHVETEAHEVILAEGAPTETFVDNSGRGRFDNVAEHEALYGDAPIAEMDLPRVTSARQVPMATRRRLAEMAAASAGAARRAA